MSLIAFVVPFYGAVTIMAQLGVQSPVQASLQQVSGPVLWRGMNSNFS